MKSAHTKGTFLLNLSIAALSAYCLLACGSDSSSNPDFEADTDISSGDTNPSNNGSSSSKKTSSSSTVKVSSSSGISKSVFLNESLSYGELIDERDGQTYKTILIGTRYWMAENLNYKTENSYCYLEEESYCNLYGRLYTWDAAMDNNNTADSIVRGVCPQGWHLPNYEDYSILFGNVGGIRVATLKLQGSNEFHGSNQNEYGFSAAPAGYKDYSGYYAGREDGAYFWINRETGDSSAYIAQLYDGGLIRANTFYKGDVLTDWYFAEFNIVKKLNANSVRCVRDTVPGDPTITPIIWRYMPKDFPYGEMVDGKQMLIPAEKYGLKIISIGFFIKPGSAAVWRGPMASNALKQLITDTLWGDLDYFIIDTPPGTSDIHLTIMQTLHVSGAIIVSTPQNVALADAQKGIDMYMNEKINIPIIGLVENMAYFTPAELPENKYYIFGKDGVKKLAEKMTLPLLGQIPLVQSICESGDEGAPIATHPETITGMAFHHLADAVVKLTENIDK